MSGGGVGKEGVDGVEVARGGEGGLKSEGVGMVAGWVGWGWGSGLLLLLLFVGMVMFGSSSSLDEQVWSRFHTQQAVFAHH